MENHSGDPSSFSSVGRNLEQEDEIRLITVGVDIGSSTSHLIYSSIVMERLDNRYVVSECNILRESDVLLTPYADDLTIDTRALDAFINSQYRLADVTRDEIDTGALILTGVAVRRANARAVGELFASQAGKFVAVSAGDAMEATLVAFGSGAVARSKREPVRVMNVDIGGGTSKIAVCLGGEIVDITVIDVGARLICFDKSGRTTRVEEAGRRFAAEAGVSVEIGESPGRDGLRLIVELMADRLFQAMGAHPLHEGTAALLRLEPMNNTAAPDVVTFSGGVSEYIYGREDRDYGDLGPMLATAVSNRMKEWRPRMETSDQGIRATVVGAAQHTVQVSGSTIFVAPHDTLPLRNVPVVRPDLPLAENLHSGRISQAVERALRRLDLQDGNQPAAICFQWRGSASFARLDAFCRGIIRGVEPLLSKELPLVLVNDGDIGGLVGLHCKQECLLQNPVVSIDGIVLKEFDFIDIGALLAASSAVPVVIKSLVFPSTAALGRA